MDSMIVALFFALLEVAEQRLMTGRCCRSAKQKQDEGTGVPQPKKKETQRFNASSEKHPLHCNHNTIVHN